VSEQMLTEEQCAEFRRLPGTFNDMIRDIYEAGRASKAAEYADVPPEKWKALYRSCAFRQRGFEGLSGELYEAMKAIDSGTYNPKIGGEE